jgi:hypothetical protein
LTKKLFPLLPFDRRRTCQLLNLGEEKRCLSDRDDAVIALAPRFTLV